MLTREGRGGERAAVTCDSSPLDSSPRSPQQPASLSSSNSSRSDSSAWPVGSVITPRPRTLVPRAVSTLAKALEAPPQQRQLDGQPRGPGGACFRRHAPPGPNLPPESYARQPEVFDEAVRNIGTEAGKFTTRSRRFPTRQPEVYDSRTENFRTRQQMFLAWGRKYTGCGRKVPPCAAKSSALRGEKFRRRLRKPLGRRAEVFQKAPRMQAEGWAETYGRATIPSGPGTPGGPS